MLQALIRLTLLVLAFAPALAPAAGPATGQRGFYAGAAVGASRAEDWCGPFFDTVVLSCDNTAPGYKAFGGYRFNEFLGVEAAYVDFGRFNADLIILGDAVSDKARFRGGTAQAVLYLPITGQFDLFGKAGGIYWDVRSDTTINGAPANRSGNGFDVAVGIGAQYSLTRHFALRAEYELFPNLGKPDTTGDVDQHLVTLGAVWKF
jgi:OOP family OmpA-OmpF porin